MPTVQIKFPDTPEGVKNAKSCASKYGGKVIGAPKKPAYTPVAPDSSLAALQTKAAGDARSNVFFGNAKKAYNSPVK